jgi:cysteine synthase A
MKYDSILETIGGTPLLSLHNYKKAVGAVGNISAKLEFFNPGASAKDRVALAMINDAEKSGKITRGATVVEATSGNTGIGLAMVCAARGYKMVLVMPETMSVERIKLARQYGAEVVLTDGKKGMAGSMDKAREIIASTENSFMPNQFDNPVNPYIHSITTAKELIRDTNGDIDYFVACIGTAGTLCGVAKGLKEALDNVKIIGVEPDKSPLLTKGYAGAHGIQGIGTNFIPKNYDASLVDEVIDVSLEDSLKCAKLLAKTEGALVGISSGAALAVATRIAMKEGNANKNIIAFLPDTGERYLSTALFEN